MGKRRIIISISAALAVAATSLTGIGSPASVVSAEDGYFVDEEKLPFEPLEGATPYWGVLGNAAFRAEVPENWNGDLVMWAHGFRGDGMELTVDNHPIREHLIDEGFAWAASSYERNGYDILTGVESTRILTNHVNDELLPQEANLVYLSGFSMGGHITGVAMEQDHRLYDGALPMCGVMGDYELFDFFLDFNLAASQLALGESAFPVDPTEWFAETVPAITAGLEGVPGGWPFVLNEQGEKFKTLVERQSGGDRPNFDEAFAYWNSFPFQFGTGDGTLPNSDGLRVTDNTNTRYQFDFGSGLDAEEREFNRDIARVKKDRNSRNNEMITGEIRDRVLSLHNLGDLFVTFEMEIDYARDVRKQGRSNRLVQRAIRGVGHCDFTQWEMTTAFDDLVTWVETGVRPAGDDVLRPRAVADEDFGCKFSDPDHTLHQFAVPCD